MPASNVDLGLLGVKVITVFPGNHGTGRDAHQGVVLVFDSQHGSLEAILGACSAVTSELDTATVRSAEVYVDSMDAAFKEAGDIVIPIKEGAILDSHVRGELSQVVAGTIRGRSDRDAITLFKAVGQAFEDLASARAVVDLARRSAAGTSVSIGGRHFAGT